MGDVEEDGKPLSPPVDLPVTGAMPSRRVRARNGQGVARAAGEASSLTLGPWVARDVTRQLVQRLIRGLEVRVTAAEWPEDREKRLRALEVLVEVRDTAQARIDHLVLDARRAGASWGEIARVVRLTRQAVHSRYRHRV